MKTKILLFSLIALISSSTVAQYWSSSGDVKLTLDADTNNAGEGDNALIQLRQDGGLTGAYFGFNNQAGGNFQPDNLLRIGVRYGNIDHWNAIVIRPDNRNIGIDTPSPSKKLDVVGRLKFRAEGNSTAGFWLTGNDGVEKAFVGQLEVSSDDAVGIWHGNAWRFAVHKNGKIGIGIGTANPNAKLEVNGDIHAKEVRVNLIGWPDFVFKNDYILPSLEAVEAHIKAHGHLKDIPSEAEVKENGINLGEMDAKLLQKIEELTLYIIALNKKVKKLESENSALKAAFNIKE